MKKIYMGSMIDESERTVNVKDVISLIDEQVEFLKQQNGMGALMGLLNMFDDKKVKQVVNTNNALIKELMSLRMQVLELGI